ncbi:hypothetical protein EJB05_34660 [Eragrostis curvula]|uniref:Uncharacterized protein n=1 Tax=Eragrostis curvula TaxID=38414 RepID=A0A5J9U4S0_9POAL|nr:hypothetical protein EJB05_34660 [Eragrostis curvula]
MDANIGDPRFTPSVERAFEGQPERGFLGHVTLRALIVSAVLAVIFCFIDLRIHMTAGIVPSMNMPITVLSFFYLKWLVSLMKRCGIAAQSFTRQENTFVVTAVNGCVNVALTGGFATCTAGMSSIVAKTLVDNPNKSDIVENVDTGRYMLFLLLIGLAAVFVIIPFKQIMLIDYRLLFPSGTVSALLVNSFHTPEGADAAKIQVSALLKSFYGSLCWTVFQWFYTAGNNCGFQSFPTFGLKLYQNRFYFDFSTLYVGLGMVCPHIVNFALLCGAIISWGILYPYIESKQGDWYYEKNPTSLNGSNGYKVCRMQQNKKALVFIGVTIILTDGLFNFFTLVTASISDFYNKTQEQDSGMASYVTKHPSLSYDDRKRIELLISDQIPRPLPVIGYILCATISSVVIPSIFHQIKFYHVAALYIIAPVFAFCNSYGVGLTDWSAAPTYGKFTIFIISAWIGQPGAVVAALVSCSIMIAAVHISSQAMQDFKTGYMTLTSPQVMVAGQIYGIILGAIINPCIYYAFKETVKNKLHIGAPHSEFPCPYAGVYRAIGVIGMGGIKELPKHCVTICIVTSCITIAIDSLRLVSQRKGWTIQNYIPSMTAFAVPFFTGAGIAISMSMGSVVKYVWKYIDSSSEELLSAAVAGGLISGEGLFALPTAILTMNKVEPPICMKFLPSGEELREVDAFLGNLASAN